MQRIIKLKPCQSRIKSILVLLLSILSQITLAQGYYKKNYSNNTGLPSSEIYHVLQDSKGYIWFCSNQGISRYDGYQFTNFDITDNLPENTVFEAFEDYKGRIWFTSLTDKLFYFDNNQFYNYPYNDTIEKYRLFKLRKVSKRTFFVDTSDNIYYTRYYEKPIVIDKHGNAKWYDFNGNGNTIVKINKNGNILNNYTQLDSTPCFQDTTNRLIWLDIPKKFYTTPFSHSVTTKNFLVISSNNKICVINKITGLHKTYEFENKIIWLSVDYNSILWVGMFYKGIKGYENMNLNSPKFHLLKSCSVSSICKDSEGGYWATTLNNGAFYFPSLQVRIMTKNNQMKNKSISSVTSNDNTIWFAGNSAYIYSLNNELLKEWLLKNEICQDINNLIWFNNQLFISIINPKIKTIIYNPEKGIIKNFSFYFYQATKTSDDNIFFCTSAKYYQYKEPSLRSFSFPDNINTNYVYDLFLDKDGSKWFATERGLIKEKNGGFYEMKDSNQIFKNRITCIEGKENELWLGTRGAGIINKNKISVINYTTKDGLPSNSIHDIIVRNDTIWIATNKGVSRFINNPTKKLVEQWSTANGLTSNEVNDIELANGNVYVATQNGLCYFPQSMCGINKTPPPVYINKIAINNKDSCLLNEYVLNYRQNYLTFSFIGINYQQNENIQYRYRLSGIDKKWNYTTQTEARYSALRPGKYSFQVEAINNSGLISDKPAQVNVHIKMPFWQTKWFIIISMILLALIIGIIVFLIFQNKMRVYKKQNFLKQELNKFRQKALSAQMNPHFLYNTINSAQYFILNNQANIASDYLSNLGSLMRIILNNSMHEEISLKNELDALYLYIKMEKNRFNNNFIFIKTIDNTIDLTQIYVPPLILQPYVENAIHHGLRIKQGDKLLKLNIRKIENSIIMEIEDNGIGRNHVKNFYTKEKNQEKHTSFGSIITQRRLEILEEIYSQKTVVEIKDLFNHEQVPIGTRVTLKIKQKRNYDSQSNNN